MPKLPDLVNGFKMLREVDLNAVRLQAEKRLYVMVVGEAGAGKTALIAQLVSGPRAGEPPGFQSISMNRPEPTLQIPDDALVLLLLEAGKPSYPGERVLFDGLIARKVSTVVCYNASGMTGDQIVKLDKAAWAGAETAVITASDRDTLVRELAPAVLRACKGREVRLARYLPLLRAPVAQKLIDDTCLINATYSLTTGLAEIIPFLDLPLNVADVIVLTKNQALMAYEITLAMGMQAEWRDTIPKMTAVIGSAFLWRQLGRYLAGLIPVIGIVPKIVISYSGTYVIGEAIYQWCANGEKLNPEELKALYAVALERGSEVAKALIEKSDAAGALTQKQAAGRFRSAISFMAARSQDIRQQIASIADSVSKPAICRACGKKSPKDATFCAFCGKPLNS
ncbi:MAG: hypothetical protein ABSF74_09665 [Dehalococcoidia bacterium]|jgi:ribosomal protein L40E/uncharacterized protein (DUF697 family)